MKLSFLGAAGEVTGSCFLVDCGMFQGGREAQRKNRRFAFAPKDIAFVLLSHAHIDHSGLLPRLAAQGFSGPVYATAATGELLSVMLPDSGHLQEREAGRDGEAPLYTVAEAQESLRLLRSVDYGVAFKPHPILGWLGGFHKPPEQTYVVHGEPLAAHALRDSIEERLGWRASVPQAREQVALD